jgi:3-(3-hydroxy-phenyl)propionate hydroxylase
MEATLRKGVERFPNAVTVHFGQKVTDVAQDETGVTLTAVDTETAAVQKIRSRYVLACDGGSSTMRAKLGVELVGKSYDQM